MNDPLRNLGNIAHCKWVANIFTNMKNCQYNVSTPLIHIWTAQKVSIFGAIPVLIFPY